MKTREELKAFVDSLNCSEEEKARIIRTVEYHTPKIEKYLKDNLRNNKA